MELILIAAFGSLALLVGEVRDYVRRDRASKPSALRFEDLPAQPERTPSAVECADAGQQERYDVAA